MNQAGAKDSLMTYESVSNTQAVLEKVSKTTTERKIMSTKTSIKRIALVAVAALGFGMVSAVSSNAAISNAASAAGRTIFTATTGSGITQLGTTQNYTLTQVAGTGNFVGFTANTEVTSDGAAGSALQSVSVVVTGSTLLSGNGAYWSCSAPTSLANAGGSIAGDAYAAGVWTAGANTSKLKATSVAADQTAASAACAAKYGTGSAAPASGVSAGFKVATPTAGSITVSVYGNEVTNGVVSSTLLQTFTVIVGGSTTYASAKITSTKTAGAYQDATASGTNPTVLAKSSLGAATNITVGLYGSDGQPFTGIAPAVTASLSGVGYLTGNSQTGSYIVWTAGTYAGGNITVNSDGRAGTATVTIAVNGVTVGTSTVVFYGAVKSLTAVANYSIAKVGGNSIGTTLAATAIDVTALDANGTVIPGGISVVESSSKPAVIAPEGAAIGTDDGNNSGLGVIGFALSTAPTAVSGDTANVAFTYFNTDGTVVTSNTLPITVGGAAKTYALSLDQSSYAPGDAMVLTITAKDASGNPVYDTFATTYGPTSNKSVIGLPATVKFVGGKKTVKTGLYAPATDGDFVVSFLNADGLTYTTTTANVSGSSSAAVDAANEATDAANAATDAANAAAEAADAATAAAQDAQAAVAALATQVASLVAGIKAQITSLTNLVIKIQKKVKA